MKRKISAILAADIAGYSRLVAEDEEETIRRLATYREVFDDFVTRYGGRIFNTAGDAVLAEFPSSVEAVRCAIDVQESVSTRNLAYPPSRHMSFRIGITIGDVIEREGDLLGDGVNIAARLEGLAVPGGICVSRSVYEQVLNKISVTFKDIGDQHVKNIPNAVHAYLVAFQGASSDHNGPTQRPPWRQKNWLIVGAALASAIIALLIPIIGGQITQRKTSDATQTAKLSAAPAPVDHSNVKQDFAGAPSPFDGLWDVSLTGNEHCVYQSSEFRITVANGTIAHSTPEHGNVETTGDFRFSTPSRANPNLTIRYLGRLSGNTGEGTYQVLGSKCGGTLALKRFN